MLRMRVEIEIDKLDDGHVVTAIVSPRRGISSSRGFKGADMLALYKEANEWALGELTRLASFAQIDPDPDPLSVPCTLCLAKEGDPCAQLVQTSFAKKGEARKVVHPSRRDAALRAAGEKALSECTPLPYPRSGPHVELREGMRVRGMGAKRDVYVSHTNEATIFFRDGSSVSRASWVRGEWLVTPQ